MTTSSPRAVLAVVCSATFFGVLNASAVNVVLPEMGTSYGASAGALGWVMSIFLLTYGVAIPVYGRLADRYGARPLFVLGLVVFAVGSALCAIAPTLETMIAARVVQALGGAAFPGLGMALVSRAFAAESRGVALGTIAAVMGVGSATGPLAGGLVADFLSWRLLFGLSGAAILIVPFARHVLPREVADPDAEIDLLGGALLALAVSATLLGVGQVAALGVSHPMVWGVLLLAVVAGVALTWRQSQVARPFLPRVLLGTREYLRVLLMGFFTTGANLGALIAIPLLLAGVHNFAAFDVGLVLLPGAVMTALMGVLAGRWVDRSGPKGPIVLGAITLMLVMLVLSRTAGQSPLSIGVLAGAMGGAYSLINTPLAAAITRIVKPAVFANALSLHTMVFFSGGSFGTALAVGVASARGQNESAWNPLHSGLAVGFSDAFLMLAVPMLCVVILAAGMGPLAPSPRS